MRGFYSAAARAVVAGIALGCSLAAATSTSWQISGFSDFSKGKLSGLSLSADGTLQPGWHVNHDAALGQPAAWSIVAAPSGGVYAATGHGGKIVQVSAAGRVSPVWSAPEAEVFALATSGGALFAGTSPNGGLYRIDQGGARLLWKSPAKYIWAICAAADGALYVATGEEGRIYRIQSNGAAEVYFETGQSNVTALAFSSHGHLIAGTDPNGLVYDIAEREKGTVIYDSSLPEIRSIAIAQDGTVYVAAMGGAVPSRSAPAGVSAGASPATVTATTPTVVTVSEAADQSSSTAASQTQSTSSTSSSSAITATQPSTAVEISGADKSAIYKITPEHAVETLRTSKEDNVYDIALDGNDLLAATDVHGRLYRLSGHQSTLLAELGDGAITRILQVEKALYAVMSNPGRVFMLGGTANREAAFESPVHDAGSVARWGHMQSHGIGSGVWFETRTGFSARPDRTWGTWAPVDAASSLIKSPAGRFIQFRAHWAAGSTASIDTINVPYLSQNNAPAIHSISVTSVFGQNASKTNTVSAAAANAPYSITVTDTGEAPAASTGTSASQTVSHLQTTQTQISWQAEDPDGDRLAYSVYFRAEEEKDWQLVRSRMFENTLLLDPDVFADGRYFFRVVASDAPSNAPEYAQEAEMISTPVLIDNTPPEVHVAEPHREAATLDVDVTAEDKTSPLRVCEYSLDAGSWQPIEASDGVTDSPRETFHLHLEKLRPGEHLLVFRVYDVVNNAGLAKVILH